MSLGADTIEVSDEWTHKPPSSARIFSNMHPLRPPLHIPKRERTGENVLHRSPSALPDLLHVALAMMAS